MATPAYVLTLRQHVGTSLLFLPAAAGVVRDDDGRVLLHRRSDSGLWALPGGILEPGEQPAEGAVREICEETGIVAVPLSLSGIYTGPVVTYPNGDRAQYVTSVFSCHAVGGCLEPNPDESLDAAFFALAELPELPPLTMSRLEQALSGRPAQFWVGPARRGRRPPLGCRPYV